MTNRPRWVLQAAVVALVAACGGTASDDIVIRTDVESSANSPASSTPATTAADTQAAAATAERKDERTSR